jgi:hypothetical protein
MRVSVCNDMGKQEWAVALEASPYSYRITSSNPMSPFV